MYCRNFITSTLIDVVPNFYQKGEEKQEFSPVPIILFLFIYFLFFFWEQSKDFFLKFESLFTLLNETQGVKWDSHTKAYGGYSCCNKNFQILLTSDFHQQADDVNWNHNYIACLIIL